MSVTDPTQPPNVTPDAPLEPTPDTTSTSAPEEAPEFYCPGCGKRYDYRRECTGRGEAPHAPIEVVSTDELKNSPDESDKEAFREWQSKHTAAPASE